MAVTVAGRGRDGAATLLGDRQEMMGLGRGLHRIHRDLHVAVRAVLEAHRAGETRGELAMHLALGRARADGAPGDEVRDVLRRDHVEELAAGRQAHLVDAESSRPRARRRPSLMRKLPSRPGSLIRPFQPTVVRGFSK